MKYFKRYNEVSLNKETRLCNISGLIGSVTGGGKSEAAAAAAPIQKFKALGFSAGGIAASKRPGKFDVNALGPRTARVEQLARVFGTQGSRLS